MDLELSANEPMLSIGLLGVELPASQCGRAEQARLEEIERRILAIEETLKLKVVKSHDLSK